VGEETRAAAPRNCDRWLLLLVGWIAGRCIKRFPTRQVAGCRREPPRLYSAGRCAARLRYHLKVGTFDGWMDRKSEH
jgi:hypothetical protein